MAKSELAQEKLHVRTITWEKLAWLDIEQPTQRDIEYLKQNYHFDDLELEDCLRRVHRPKIDEHEGYVFVMSHFPVFHTQARVTLPSQVSFFLGEDYLITLHQGDLEPLRKLFKDCRVEGPPGPPLPDMPLVIKELDVSKVNGIARVDGLLDEGPYWPNPRRAPCGYDSDTGLKVSRSVWLPIIH